MGLFPDFRGVYYYTITISITIRITITIRPDDVDNVMR